MADIGGADLENEDELLYRLQLENAGNIQKLIPQLQAMGIMLQFPAFERRLLEGIFAGMLGPEALRDAKIAHELDLQQILSKAETDVRQFQLTRGVGFVPR